MEIDFWLSRWQEKRIGFHQHSVNQYLVDTWPDLKIKTDSNIFVPLCGKSVDMIWLKEQGHSVLGIEISPTAVKDFFSENNLIIINQHDNGTFETIQSDSIKLHAGDFFDLKKTDLPGIKAVYDRASLIALPESMRHRYVQHMAAILPTNTPIFLITMEYNDDEMKGPPFSVSEKELYELFSDQFTIKKINEFDSLKDSPNLKKRGLTKMHEKLWVITRI